MKIVKQSSQITRFNPYTDLKEICDAAQICYKSKPKKDSESAEKFIKSLIKRGHMTPLEHSILSVIFTTNRGVSHELVRHRLAAFNQESTRYCNYTKDRFENEVTFISNSRYEKDPEKFEFWKDQCRQCEQSYFDAINNYKMLPDEARGFLNNDVKTEIKVTANYREWRHIFELRCSPQAHYQMRELMIPLLKTVSGAAPWAFEDLMAKCLITD